MHSTLRRVLPMMAVTILLGTACTRGPGTEVSTEQETPAPIAAPPTPLFDPDSAYAYVAGQVAFGPRVPGSDAHKECGNWIVARMKNYGADVREQIGEVTAFNGQEVPLRNIIASWLPDAQQRVMLCAHWDSRPFADHDKERPNDPIDGANDGASGVGILMELARHLNELTRPASGTAPGIGVDLIFFDVEDMGEPANAMGGKDNSMDTWCLGSQYWVKQPHEPGYSARFGILLDMCGARDAVFYQEAISMRYASGVVRKVWRTADRLGYGDRFIPETKYFVGTDDHDVINRSLRIPTIDIIEYYEPTGGFNPTWHTHGDNMDVIDPNTLKAVGQTIMEVVWKER
ncbi:MAG: M28 family peptidase [Flavobacteriales bacterium]|nr:M28 family peptidase [Flavobacteriales bacterium]MCB9193947.1 M28 family peptidase [Flavobacteriales bacterium]